MTMSDPEKDYPDGYRDKIEYTAQVLKDKYGLTYRAQVNLEAAMRNAVLDGTAYGVVVNLVEDMLENIEFQK
jgi:hypothetical protein